MGEIMLREMQLSMMFPGFKFSPTDEELISYYLKKKIEGSDSSVQVIPEVDLCQFEPWELPEKSVIQSNSEWFFFSNRGRKYPNGLQSKRATECGYWKATGKERNVKSNSNIIGTKRTLVFHKGRAPKGERTEWIMHEYCMTGNSQDSLVVCRLRKNSEFRLNENPERVCQNQLADNSFDNDKAVDGCNSSYNSHSGDPNDSGSECVQNVANHRPAEQKDGEGDGEGEEDCFAEILNDDIIKLDESSLPDDSNLERTEIKLRQVTPKVGLDSIPTQGAANRRIRLGQMQTNSYHLNSANGLEVGNDVVFVHRRVQTVRWVLVKWQFMIIMVLVIFSLVIYSFVRAD